MPLLPHILQKDSITAHIIKMYKQGQLPVIQVIIHSKFGQHISTLQVHIPRHNSTLISAIHNLPHEVIFQLAILVAE